jgi:hypothetical protein
MSRSVSGVKLGSRRSHQPFSSIDRASQARLIHRHMRILASNRMEDLELSSGKLTRVNHRGASVRSHRCLSRSGEADGYQTERLPAVRKRTRRIFHRCCPRRLAVRCAGARPRARRPRHLRAGRAHRLAHPSARADTDRQLRAWLGTAEGGPIEEIRPGDVIWFPPGEKHWHGATATTGMSHFAIQEALNGSTVEWMEKVSDAQYRLGLRTGE